jgi:hypothetical protein
VRSRLLLLIGVPTLAALLLGGFGVYSSVSSAQAYGGVQRLANLANGITGLVQSLQDERLDTVTFITLGTGGGRAQAQSPSPSGASGSLELLHADYARTNRAATQVSSLAQTIGSGYPTLAQQQAKDAITAIGDLSALRQASVKTKLPAATVIADYGNAITQLLTLENEVSAGSNDASLADNVRVLSLVSSMKEEAAQEQAILTSALLPSASNGFTGVAPLSSQELSVLDQQEAEQTANLAAFNLAATTAQRQLYNNALSSSLAAPAQAQVQQATSLLAGGAAVINTSDASSTISEAATNASLTISGLRAVEEQLTSSITGQAGSLHTRALTTAIIEAVAALLVLALALLLTTVIGRSMAQPLRRLRAGALDIADNRLPETVRLMSETDGKNDIPLEIEPIDVDSTDEIGEVARAFDQVHREALRLAANEAALRGNVNAMFVNLSRRSQTLVDRQIHLIDNLAVQPVPAGPPGHPYAAQLGEPAGSRGSRRLTPVEPAGAAGGRAPRRRIRDRAVRAGNAQRPAGHRGPRPGRQRRRAPARRAHRERHLVLVGGTAGHRVRSPAEQRRRAAPGRHGRRHRARLAAGRVGDARGRGRGRAGHAARPGRDDGHGPGHGDRSRQPWERRPSQQRGGGDHRRPHAQVRRA